VSGLGGAVDLNWLQKQFPDLKNLSALNRGGQKLVFAGTHASYGEVVLKLIHPSQAVEATKREILAVAQVNSPRVPEIFLDGTVAIPIGTCFWFLERRIVGPTLRELLATGPLSDREVLRLGLHMLETLSAAAQVKIVHRDVKPENIIRDGDGDYWLIDFGIARHLGLKSLTATVSAFGKFTPGYAPPEQFLNIKSDIDQRCDLFALGLTLYECGTGSNPFIVGTRDHLEVLKRSENMPLAPLTLNVKSAKEFADLIAAMTQKRRDHRPSKVKEAYEWMTQICDAEGV
jgi:serine/threonine-protein kinase